MRSSRPLPVPEEDHRYWAEQLERQTSAARHIADRYLGWMEILAEKPEQDIALLGPQAVRAVRKDLSRAPSLSDLANGRVGSIPILQGIRDAAPADS